MITTNDVCTRCDQKITLICKYPELHMFDLPLFFCYVGTYVCYTRICWQYLPLWIDSLFLTDEKISRALVCSSIFYFPKKWIKETDHLKCSLWHLASLLWAEHEFNCGRIGLWKVVKILMTMLVLNIEPVKKVILDNWRITIREVADDVGI